LRWANQHTHKPFTGAGAAKEIDRVAKALGLKITGSYRTFIRQLGSENDFGLNGVNNEYRNAGTLWTTRVMRKEYGLPRHYLVV
jgi:hypothetical protein